MKTSARPVEITPDVLRRLALPRVDEGGDKEERGRVLCVGGSRQMPGAVVLAALAALRAGAGKLRVATATSAAPLVAAQVFEARVYPLAETKAGDIAAAAAARLGECAEGVRAICVGPGMVDEKGAARLVRKLLSSKTRATLVLDANALAGLHGSRRLVRGLERGAVLTPNGDELGGLLGGEDPPRRAGAGKTSAAAEDKSAAAAGAARRIADEYGAVAVVKGRETFIAAPGGELYVNRAGNVGLATSGSGDVLAGVVAGLAARGAGALAAAVWGVHVHAHAGDRLAERVGRLGYLARELLDEIPRVLEDLEAEAK
jgi:hydroxyethylthiazole kinase-like uncharacterized protein yjeF